MLFLHFAERSCLNRVRVCLCRVFIPNYISKVKVQLVNCSTKNKSSDSCPVVLKIRARAPPVHNSSALDCREWRPCELVSLVPAWEQWYYILVERYLSNSDVYFRIGVQVTGQHEWLTSRFSPPVCLRPRWGCLYFKIDNEGIQKSLLHCLIKLL